MRRALFLALGALGALAASVVACGLDMVGQATSSTTPAGADASPGGGAAGDGGSTPGDGSPPVVDLDGGDAGPDASAPDAAPDAGPRHALAFTGGSYVAVDAFGIPADFTLEAWVRPASYSGETLVIAKDRRNQGAAQCRLGFDATGHLFFLMSDSAGDDHGLYSGGYVLVSPAALPLATWSHVAVTKNGPAFALYVDGAQVKTFAAGSAFTYGGPVVEFRIAARVDTNGTSDSALDGAIDEVRVWSVARTQAQIAAARSTVIAPSDPSFSSLTGYWRFDDGSGTSAADVKIAHPGTLTGGPTWITSTPF